MNRAIWHVGWSYLRHHLGQTLLMVLGIALGVAVIVAIDLANGAATRAFDLSTEAIAGRATHEVTGGPLGLDQDVYRQIRASHAALAAAPVMSDYVVSPQWGNRPLQLLGIDPLADAPFRSYVGSEGVNAPRTLPTDQLTAFYTRPGAVLLSEELAAQYGLQPGQALDLEVGGRRQKGVIAGLLSATDSFSRRALSGLVIADIATAQELTGRLETLDRVDLILPEGNEAAAEAIRRILPAGAQLSLAGAQAGALAQMTSAFQTNLVALSLLALLVGTFLIYNSMTFSVVQRRPLFGTLRCLGATREEIASLILAEAAIVGALGSIIGVALGLLLGQGAVQLVTQTVNDLYFVVTVRGITASTGSVVKGAAVGVLATLAAAAIPAREASLTPPRLIMARSNVEEAARRRLPLTTAAGVASLLVGGGVLLVPTRSLFLSFSGLFFISIGCALLAPAITLGLLELLGPPLRLAFGVLGRMAPRNLFGSLSRTAVAIAALMTAMSVTIGVGLMVGSFRETVVVWLGQTLHRDLYVSAPSTTATRSSAVLDPRVVEIAMTWPGAREVEMLRSADVASDRGQVIVAAVSAADFVEHRMLVDTPAGKDDVARAVRDGAVLISEPLANRQGLAAGDAVRLRATGGWRDFPVAGVYRDYSSSQGTVMMALDLYRSHWDDRSITAVSLDIPPDQDPDAVAAAMTARANEIQSVVVRANAALRSEVLVVFDRAFAITGALQMLAAIVAFIGVLSALLALQLERGRELGILRAVGLTAAQLRTTILLETGLMGASAGFLAMPTGLLLALVLIYIINRRSFGWTMELHVTGALFLQALLLAVAAALLAGLYPAIRMGRMLAAEALRSE